MDSGAPNQGDSDDRRNQQVDNAIRAIREKKPPVEIDFSIHVMEDGTQVSTNERVCKGKKNQNHTTQLLLRLGTCCLSLQLD